MAGGSTRRSKKWFWLVGVLLAGLLLILAAPLKRPLFPADYSTVIRDRQGVLLGARIAADEQWRFPRQAALPEKYTRCVLLFEDKNFFLHPGVDPGALLRAFYLNIKYHGIVSGGSTLTMQVIRLSRQGRRRTYLEKLLEGLLALKLELLTTKKEILALYAAHAPFGGNTVGLEAAAWRYFGRDADNISWAEAALLAVLPNNPSLLHLGQNRELLLAKRNRLLSRLAEQGELTPEDLQLAQTEPLPEQPYPLPRLANQLLDRVETEGWGGQAVTTSLESGLQQQVSHVIERHYRDLAGARIRNAAALVLDIDSGQALAYVGNTTPPVGEVFANEVDIITARRSTGSLLKPFLYAFYLDEGLLLPGELVQDIPLIFREFAPGNDNHTYQGAVPASEALARSLNVPFVYLLQEYNYHKFYHRLTQLGMNWDFPADHYGLSLIIGGSESTLWTLGGIYASLARVLKNYDPLSTTPYSQGDYHPATYLLAPPEPVAAQPRGEEQGLLGAGALWLTFEAMQEVLRPVDRENWQRFTSSRQVAWKTGTSFGNRDAWAIGLTPEYLVAVWVGNASGEGRPEIRGSAAAGPILFDIFELLPATTWFDKPYNELEIRQVCRESGMLASPLCPETIRQEVPLKGSEGPPCSYHVLVHLDREQQFQVDSSNYPLEQMVHRSWFILPPVQEFYYKRRNNQYRSLPPPRQQLEAPMAFIYPSRRDTTIFVPIELDGSPGRCIFELAHRKPESTVYWHLDGIYLGLTRNIHQLGLYPTPGEHELVVVDEEGQLLSRTFTAAPGRR